MCLCKYSLLLGLKGLVYSVSMDLVGPAGNLSGKESRERQEGCDDLKNYDED